MYIYFLKVGAWK